MKIIRILCGILAVLSIFNGMSLLVSGAQVQEDNDTVVNSCYTLDATLPYLGNGMLVENAHTVFLYEMNTDTLVYGWNQDAQVFPSSIIKVLTAYLSVLRGDPADVITVSESALSNVPYDAVSADLQVGEQLTLEDLIHCMMVGSANDAASVIAEHISGSEEAFVAELNAFVQELGCTATVIKNPHGLHDPEQVSTPRDLCRIVSEAVKNESFCKYFSAIEYTVPATNLSEERRLISKNFHMNDDDIEVYYDKRVTGGRTGIAEDGTRCLATVAENNDLKLICIITGALSTYDDDGNTLIYGGFPEATALFDMVFEGYELAQILYEGQAIRQCPIANGDSDVVMGVKDSVTAMLPTGSTPETLTYRYTDRPDAIEAPIEQGQTVSWVEVWNGNICVAESELYAMNSVRSVLPDSLESDKHNNRINTAGTTILIIFGAGVAIVIIYYVLRLLPKLRRRTRNYRSSRRRSR